MRSSLRFLARCLLGGTIAGVGFLGAVAVADSFTDVPGSSPFVDDIDPAQVQVTALCGPET